MYVSLAGEDVSSKLGDIPEGDRGHEVIFADRDGEYTVLLGLRCVEEEVLLFYQRMYRTCGQSTQRTSA